MKDPNEKMARLSLRLTNEAIRLIRAEARRKGKTLSQVLCDLIANSVLAETNFDPYDPNWESQMINDLVIKHLKVN